MYVNTTNNLMVTIVTIAGGPTSKNRDFRNLRSKCGEFLFISASGCCLLYLTLTQLRRSQNTARRLIVKLKQQDHHIDMSKQNRRNLPRALMTGMIIAVVFLIGVNVGNGRIRLDRGSHDTQNSSLPATLNYDSVNEVYKALKENYDGKLTEKQLLDGLKEGLALATKDPYTEYFTSSENKDYLNQVDGTFSGIGAQLGKNAEGNLEVIAPIVGTPADKAGLKAKDVITQINGESTANISIENAVKKIRGKNGTSVELKIARGDTEALTLTIVRSDITVPSVMARKLDS